MLFVLMLTATAFSQEQQKPLTLEDYPEWSRIGSTSISNDGVWVSYTYSPNEGDDTLYLKNIESQKLYEEPYGSGPAFSDNGEWAAFFLNVPEKQAKKLRKSKKTVYKKAVLLNLTTGEKKTWDKAARLTFSPSSDYLVITKQTGNKEAKGKDMLLVSLHNGWTFNLGNVSNYAFNSQGSHLAYLIDAADRAGNGLYLFNLSDKSVNPIDTDTLTYTQLSWDDAMLFSHEKGQKGTALMVLKGAKADTLTQYDNQLVIVSGIGQKLKKQVLGRDQLGGIPDGFVISEKGTLRFSLDNERIVLAIKEQAQMQKLGKDTLPNVDVWHWNDEQIQSVQMRRASRERNRTFTGVLHLNDLTLVQLTDENYRGVSLNRNADRAVVSNPVAYISDVNWGGGFSDYYQIDIRSGEKKLIGKKIGRSMGLSPEGDYYLYFKDRHFHCYRMTDQTTTNLTIEMLVSFFDEEEDHPFENPSYGMAGWTMDGKSVILNHRYDLWQVALDGSGGKNLTGNYGTEQEIRFRMTRLDRKPSLDPAGDIYLSAYGEWTKKSGYFKLKPGKAPRELLFTDASIGRLQKAKEADVVLFTKQTFADFPDYYTSDLSFKKIARQTDANPQQTEYLWGERILVDYNNKHGDKLQATLTLPANYEQGKQYPMLVYFYEKMSQRHHSYSMPTYDDRPHMSTYASNGYLVLMPDINYTEGNPGWNALDCITAAVQKVIDQGYADLEKIGLQGHSWGGYQSSFILTQSDMFACVVTGAPVTNLTSMFNILYKNSGTNNHGIMERGQVRMGKGMYDDMANYIAQSPVQQAAGISTPFMILHGTVDGAVDWNQGLEFYNAARRLGKEVILLSYPNENHHLADRNNQKDFQRRMKQYFDHFLMGTKAPDWMVNGIPFVNKLYENAK